VPRDPNLGALVRPARALRRESPENRHGQHSNLDPICDEDSDYGMSISLSRVLFLVCVMSSLAGAQETADTDERNSGPKNLVYHLPLPPAKRPRSGNTCCVKEPVVSTSGKGKGSQ